MPEIAYVNGEFLPLARAFVHVEDRGFQFADAVYEVLRVYHGRAFAIDEHVVRLFRSLDSISLRHGFTAGQLHTLIEEGVRRAKFADAVVYLQVTRGRAPRHRGVPEHATPTVVMTVRELPPAPAALPPEGVKLICAPDERWARCDIKSVGLLPNVLAYQAARAAGADDALFVDAAGVVAESTAGNVFVVADGRLRTPPKGPRLLSGVTRDKVLQATRAAGLECVEDVVTRAAVLAADELFLTSTTSQIVPIVEVDGTPIGSKKPGPVTARVYAEFLRLVPRG